MVATIVYEFNVGEDEVVWACACLCTGPLEGARPCHSITLTLHPLTQIQKTLRIYAEIFDPNLATKLFYRSPLSVMHCRHNVRGKWIEDQSKEAMDVMERRTMFMKRSIIETY
jgi:hypothetical protein